MSISSRILRMSNVPSPPAIVLKCRWCGLCFKVRWKRQTKPHADTNIARQDIHLCNNGCFAQWKRLYRFYRDSGVLEHGDFEKTAPNVPHLFSPSE